MSRPAECQAGPRRTPGSFPGHAPHTRGDAAAAATPPAALAYPAQLRSLTWPLPPVAETSLRFRWGTRKLIAGGDHNEPSQALDLRFPVYVDVDQLHRPCRAVGCGDADLC